ncbi:hypothetical protein R1sor_026211 [Riccia sorocarpa]|uniref:Uncharacterized protein n=1 Tax=Riccia sorocarpa TaxID=122646 RepID=A0ABD3GAS2_9MARC
MGGRWLIEGELSAPGIDELLDLGREPSHLFLRGRGRPSRRPPVASESGSWFRAILFFRVLVIPTLSSASFGVRPRSGVVFLPPGASAEAVVESPLVSLSISKAPSGESAKV